PDMTSIIAGFVLGLTWLQQQAQLQPPMMQRGLLGAVLVLVLMLACLSRRQPAHGGAARWTTRWLLLCLCASLCAVLWGCWRAERRLAELLPAALEGADIALLGTVASLPQRTER